MVTAGEIQAMFDAQFEKYVTVMGAQMDAMKKVVDKEFAELRSEIMSQNTATGTAIQQLNAAQEQLRKKLEDATSEFISHDEVAEVTLNLNKKVVVFGDSKGPNADITQQLQQVKDAIPSHITATVVPLPAHENRPRKAMATFPSPTSAMEAQKAINAARINKVSAVAAKTRRQQKVERDFTIPVAIATRSNETFYARAEGTNVRVREANDERKTWKTIPYSFFSRDDLPKDTNHPILNAVLQELFPNNTSLKTPAAASTNDTEMNDQQTPAAKNLSGTIRGRPDSTPSTVERNRLDNLKQQRRLQQQERTSSTAANTSTAAAAAADEPLRSGRLNFNA